MRFTKKAMRRKGFSLVEILVVLVIMAIITGGGMMIMGGSSDRAKYARAQQDLDVIQQAMVQYYNVRGSYDGVGDTGGTGTKKLSEAFDSQGERIFQSFVGKPIADWRDPWGDNEYQIAINYSSGKGTLVAFCSGEGSGEGASVTFPSGSGGSNDKQVSFSARKDATDDDKPMFRIIYNVNY